jgi:hypothetical protein
MPHFYAGSIGVALTAGWVVLRDPRVPLQEPPPSMIWLAYWLACTAAFFMLILLWDGWVLPRLQRRGLTGENIPPALMATLAVVAGCTIPMLGMSL